ncbi:ribonuclease [Kytococcus sedentarius]|uniref:Guanyl-specific ribonuclease Sa n=2 Tax=Kytococcus sedentarius TaxID=1276 RepID=C7NJ28_KYTSD|nr:guanyl-specific ribonuclease Sa [Kytococcus sedentarius DSM 20547]QQB65304.1 ribonuclease [Kytococcus sedentarius]
MWTARAILRILFACALAAIVIWGGGGIFSSLEDEENNQQEQDGGTPGGSGDGATGANGRGGSGGADTAAGGGTAAGGTGIEPCDEGDLSREAADVIETIAEGGEFAYPGKDGSTFGNREGLLPAEDRGYYAEYTVPTPGESDRGARRIVTGGDTTPRNGSSDPEHWYWTADHYESFCEFSG